MNSKTPIRIVFLSLILIILSCCASTSNPRILSFYEDDQNKISKKILKNISSANQRKDFIILFYGKKNDKINKFLEGARTSFFFQKSLKKNKKEISFKSITNLDVCEEIKSSSSFKIIVIENSINTSKVKCLNNLNSNSLIVNLEGQVNLPDKNSLSLKNQNYLQELIPRNTFKDKNFLYISKNMNEIENLISNLKGNKNFFAEDSFIFLEEDKNYEDEIALVFGIKDSEKRGQDLQRVINEELNSVSRARRDVSKVVISSSSDIANRLIPAFKYNFLFNLDIYNLPNHYDVWNETSTPEDLDGTYGLEHPILVNKINLGTKNFFSYSSESKIIYSLGFDLINFLNTGNGYFGLLGEYNLSGSKVKISPIKVFFEKGKIIQSLD